MKKLKSYYQTSLGKQFHGHVLERLKSMPDESIDCVVTSPPYWALRDYKIPVQIWDDDPLCKHEWDIKEGTCIKCGAWIGSLGLEPNIQLYISHLMQIFNEIKRILKKSGTCFVNLGDSYNNQNAVIGRPHNKLKHVDKRGVHCLKGGDHKLPNKCLMLIPSRFAIAMVDSGWILRNRIIWEKINAMPESVKDRFSVNHDYVFYFVKNQKYFFERQLIPLEEGTKERYKRKWDGNKDRDYPRAGTGSNFDTWMNMTDEEIANIEGRNRRTVWKISTKGNRFSKDIHFAIFPEALITPMILSGCPKYICNKCGFIREKVYRGKKIKVVIGYSKCDCKDNIYESGTVLDPFMGSGTVASVCEKLGYHWRGIELSLKYNKVIKKRIKDEADQVKFKLEKGE